MDTEGRAIVFNLGNITLGNFYAHSGTDAVSRGNREHFCGEIIPNLLINRKDSGEIGGDWNCITRKEDCTQYPESKMSPCLKRVVNTFNLADSFRHSLWKLYTIARCTRRTRTSPGITAGQGRRPPPG